MTAALSAIGAEVVDRGRATLFAQLLQYLLD